MTTCAFCRGPFHIASGDIIGDPQSYAVCGACIKEMFPWLRGHLNRRWSGSSFYAHAKVPPPAVEKKFVFTVYTLVPGTTCHYKKIEVEQTGVTFEEALIRLSEKHPNNHIAEHTRGLWREVT